MATYDDAMPHRNQSNLLSGQTQTRRRRPLISASSPPCVSVHTHGARSLARSSDPLLLLPLLPDAPPPPPLPTPPPTRPPPPHAPAPPPPCAHAAPRRTAPPPPPARPLSITIGPGKRARDNNNTISIIPPHPPLPSFRLFCCTTSSWAARSAPPAPPEASEDPMGGSWRATGRSVGRL